MENINFIIIPTNIGIEIFQHSMVETIEFLIKLILKKEMISIEEENDLLINNEQLIDNYLLINTFICKDKYQNIFLIEYDMYKNDTFFDKYYYYIIFYYKKSDKILINYIIHKIKDYLYSRVIKKHYFLSYIEMKHDDIYNIYKLYFEDSTKCLSFVKQRIKRFEKIFYNKIINDDIEPSMKKLKII
jgi:hypothetical protein